MNDNFYLSELLGSIRKETTVERYLPLADCGETLLSVLRTYGASRRDDVTPQIMEQAAAACGEETARLFSRFLHLYDFKPQKLREIATFENTEKYDVLAGLLHLPGVRLLRAQLYCDCGITLEVLAEKPCEEIRETIRAVIERDGRKEIVPLPKEVNCHRVVAAMLLHTENEGAGSALPQ